MKGYKAFEKGLICKGKKYAENTVFEEPEAIPCKCGMHFCENPMEVLGYYNLVNENGEIPEFAEVEALDEPKTYDGKKFCTKKLKVHVKLSFSKFIDACVSFLLEKTDDISSVDFSQQASSNNHSQLASLRNDSWLASSGNGSWLASSGNGSWLASSGDFSQQASSGDDSRLASSGAFSQQASSGNHSQLASSGAYSWLASSGNHSQLASSGVYSRLASSGAFSRLASSGAFSQLVSSSDNARIKSEGEHSVICCAGNNARVKAKKGSWITLSEWEYKEGKEIPKCVKTEYVDGERIKEDTFYSLKHGEFVEVEG